MRTNSPLTTSEFIRRAELVHGKKYDYTETVYVKSSISVTIKCYIHGPFSTRPLNHTFKKSGCPICATVGRKQNMPAPVETFISKAIKIHGKVYDYSLVQYKNTHTKVKVICPVHGIFLQAPVKHISQQCGCPSCNNPSHGEETIRIFLELNQLPFSREHTFDACRAPDTRSLLRFDFYIPSLNIVIEYDGQHHYIPTRYNGMAKDRAQDMLERTKWCDQIKNEFLSVNDIQLLRLPYMLSTTELENTLQSVLMPVR